jgi:RNA polymerase sigma-B factor
MIAMESNRDRVVAKYGYLRTRAARKFHRPGLDRADLEQIAAIGLLKACDRYDEDLQTPFEAFAWLFIVGELMHYVRDHERLVRPPRRLRDLERRAQEASDALVFELGREPSAREIAERMRVSLREFQELALYREQAIPQSIDALLPHQLSPCSYTLEDRDDRMVLDAALERLNDTERTIILALYASGYSQSEVASSLGYSRRHISRLHRAALKKMQPVWVSKSA